MLTLCCHVCVQEGVVSALHHHPMETGKNWGNCASCRVVSERGSSFLPLLRSLSAERGLASLCGRQNLNGGPCHQCKECNFYLCKKCMKKNLKQKVGRLSACSDSNPVVASPQSGLD